MSTDTTARSIPSLDGLRAASVLAVILGHTRSPFLDAIPLNGWFRDAGRGVDVFFVISGFLITHLLVRELNRTGTVDLKKFYLRRTFRIFPPYYVYLAAVAVLAAFQIVSVSRGEFLLAATYSWNYALWGHFHRVPPWTLAHCWSLCLEEQFYLLWPLLLKNFSKAVNIRVAAGIVLLSPLIRAGTMFFHLGQLSDVDMMFHTHMDSIMTGCLITLLLDSAQAPWLKKVGTNAWLAALAVVFLIGNHHQGIYHFVAGITLGNLAIGIVLLFGVFRHESVLGKVLNFAPLRHIGRISYSLYLWNMLFTRGGPYQSVFPINVVFIFICAELSYFLIEKPSFKLRDLVQQRFQASGKNIVGV